MRRILFAVFTLALVLAGAVSPAEASVGRHPVPFTGRISGTVTFAPVGDVCPPSDVWLGGLQTLSSGTGSATLVGRVTVSSTHCTPLIDQVQGGVMTFTAASGDTIAATYSGTCTPFDPAQVGSVIRCDIAVTVNGGTGRFVHARGAAQMKASVDYPGLTVPAWPARWRWMGWITR
jgi:hypothetical protein